MDMNNVCIFSADPFANTLAAHLDKPRVYIGCMKSGEVFSEQWVWPNFDAVINVKAVVGTSWYHVLRITVYKLIFACNLAGVKNGMSQIGGNLGMGKSKHITL